MYAAVLKTFCYALKLSAFLNFVAIERSERHIISSSAYLQLIEARE